MHAQMLSLSFFSLWSWLALLLPSETWWALPLVVEAWEAPTGAPVPILGFCQVKVFPVGTWKAWVHPVQNRLEASAASVPSSAPQGFLVFASVWSYTGNP